MKKPKFTKVEKNVIIVLMIINCFALFVNLFEVSVRVTRDKSIFDKERYYLFTDVGAGTMGVYINGENKYPSTSYNDFSSQFYPFVDFYLESNNEKRFRGVFPGFDHTEFIVYSFLILGFFILKKKIKVKSLDEMIKEDVNKNNKYYNNNNNIKSSNQLIKGKIEKLKDLWEQGILTDDEYYEKSAKIKAEKLQTELKLTEEYKKLKSLYDDGILTKEEFDTKIEKLMVKINNEETKQHDKNSLDFNISADLSEGYYLITDNEINYGFANKDYQIVIKPKYEYAESFTNGLALVRLNGKFGFINKEGNLIIRCKYDYAESFKHETALVKNENNTFYINKKGKRI